MTLEELLHPIVSKAALKYYADGNLRDAVLNAITATFDLLRLRTGLDLDGAELANQAFSEQRPYLIVGDLQSESGRNAQVGAMMLARSLYQGVRSPSVHTLLSSINPIQAARYLVSASALAQLIDDAQQGNVLRFDGVYASRREGTDGTTTTFLRFFPNGNVLNVSVGGNVADNWVPDWLTLDWAEWEAKFNFRGTYETKGDRLLCTITSENGTLTYTGQIRGLTLRIKWESTITNKRGDLTFQFRPYQRQPSESIGER